MAETVPCSLFPFPYPHGQLLWLTPRYAISKPYLVVVGKLSIASTLNDKRMILQNIEF